MGSFLHISQSNDIDRVHLFEIAPFKISLGLV